MDDDMTQTDISTKHDFMNNHDAILCVDDERKTYLHRYIQTESKGETSYDTCQSASGYIGSYDLRKRMYIYAIPYHNFFITNHIVSS